MRLGRGDGCRLLLREPHAFAQGALEIANVELDAGDLRFGVHAHAMRGRDLVSGLPKSITLSSAEIREAIAERAYRYAMEMDFRFLFDEKRKLFAIGYQAASHALDASYYDLLASEARLAELAADRKKLDTEAEYALRAKQGDPSAWAASRRAWSRSMSPRISSIVDWLILKRTLLIVNCKLHIANCKPMIGVFAAGTAKRFCILQYAICNKELIWHVLLV